MACTRSITFAIPGTSTSPALDITAVENAGKIDFTVDLQDNPQLTADLRGLFFHLADESKLSGLTYSGGGDLITAFQAKANDVIDLGNGNNMNGAVRDGFDVGLGFGEEGIGQDKSDIHDPISFTISNTANNLTLDDIAHTLFGARMTSIGSPTGARNDSSKLTVTSPAAPDAKDDSFAIFEDGQAGLNNPSHTPQGQLFEVLANDTDADGDKLTITDVSGAQHGTLHIVDGSDADALPGDAVLYTPFADYAGTDSFEYCISDGHGGQDGADAAVTVTAVADIPDLDVQVLPGEEVNQIVLRVTATQTDADSSEFIDRIATSVAVGLPAGSTITPSSINPSTVPDTLTQDFVVAVPQHEDANFDVTVTATSKETSNADEESASKVVHIETNNTQTEIQATFLATDQSIWDTGNQFTFVDDRFLGVDTSWNETGGGFVFGHSDGSFKAGFQSTLTFEGGEIDAQAVYDISVETLYNKTTDVLHLSADALLDDASFTTEGPEGSYNLDFIFHFDANVSAGLDFGDLGKLDLFNVDIGPWDLDQNILNLTSDDLSTQVPLPAGFSLTFAWPNLDTTSGALVGDTASSSGASNNFLELGLDVDDLVFTLLDLPNPFDIGFDVGIPDVASASFHAELADLDLSFGMNFLQQFAMAVTNLTGTITFEDGSSQLFDFNTDIELTNASSHDVNHDGSIGYDLLLTPSATLANDTNLGFNFGVQFDVLKLSGSYELLGAGDSFSLGPVFSAGTTVPLGSVDIYDNTFAVNYASQDFLLAA
jgi:Big-like domain-containing protein